MRMSASEHIVYTLIFRLFIHMRFMQCLSIFPRIILQELDLSAIQFVSSDTEGRLTNNILIKKSHNY